MDVEYRCRFCSTAFPVRVRGYKLDPEWDEAQPPLPRRRCPKCGAASAPATWLNEQLEQGDRSDDAFFRRWSNCLNASVCCLHDAYRGDCERGVLMPKCLQSIRQEFESLLHRLPKGKPSPVRVGQQKEPSSDGP